MTPNYSVPSASMQCEADILNASSMDVADSSHSAESLKPSDSFDSVKPSTSQRSQEVNVVVDMPQLDNEDDEPLSPTADDGSDEIDSIESETCTHLQRSQLDDDPGIQRLMEISNLSPIPVASSSDECELSRTKQKKYFVFLHALRT